MTNHIIRPALESESTQIKELINLVMYEKFSFQTIAGKQMPRYFARIKKLFDIADVFRKSGEELLVMKLE